MAQVHEATYVPNASGGGQIEADMVLGTQKISTSLPIGTEDAFVRSLLDELAVRIEKVGFLSIADRREVHVTMELGTRQFVARIPLEDGDSTLGPVIDRLLLTVETRFMRTLESSFVQAEERPIEPA